MIAAAVRLVLILATTGAKRLATFCAKHGYSGQRSGEQLLARLRAAPVGTTDETLCEAVRDAVVALVTVVKALGAALKDSSGGAARMRHVNVVAASGLNNG